MSFAKAFGQAIQRSIEMARDETVKMMRMEVSPNSKNQGSLLLYALRSQQNIDNCATGSDSDIGGLSQCRLALDEENKGRFYGTLSSQIPRGSKLDRSGYAAMRNRNRPTLFGNQCWDTSVHPYLALRVRNRLANKTSGADTPSSADAASSSAGHQALRSAIHAGDSSGPAATRAIHALGLGRKEPPGPKFFINIQTDGPVTSDLFQHRLYFDESKGSDWQTVIIPFDDFVLTNSGQVMNSQLKMMREKIRTVGISAMLAGPYAPSPPSTGSSKADAPPTALSRSHESAEAEDAAADAEADADLSGVQRGSKRGSTYNFDIGVEGLYAIGEIEEAEALAESHS